jgi:hypothetical protein
VQPASVDQRLRALAVHALRALEDRRRAVLASARRR